MKSKKLFTFAIASVLLAISITGFAAYAKESENIAKIGALQENGAISEEQADLSDAEAEIFAAGDAALAQPTAESSPQTDNYTKRSVSITTSRDTAALRLGSSITLTANLVGYDGLDYTCQWQYAEADSEGNIIGTWQNAQENGLTVSYILTEQNILTAWRVRVIVAE